MNKKIEILDKVKDYLGAKEIFLNVRQVTIERLKTRCNKLESKNNTGKFAKVNETGDLISASGNAFSSLTLGITKTAGEIIKAVNNSARRKFSSESSEAFQEHLKNDESVLPCFDKVYTSLINSVRENKLEISSCIIKILKLEGEDPNLFNIDYEVYKVATNIWKEKTHLTIDEMKKTIELLDKNSRELKSELEQEQNWFVDLQKQIDNPTIKNDVSEESNLFSNLPWKKVAYWGGVGLLIIVIWAIIRKFKSLTS